MKIVNALNSFGRIEFILSGGKSVFLPASYDYFLEGDGPKPHKNVRRQHEWWRVSCATWAQRKEQLDFWDQKGVPHFEGDVGPVRRYLIDHPETEIENPRSLYLDFEADSRRTFFQHTTGQSRVLCWSVKDKQDGRVTHRILNTDDDQDERRLLLELWEIVKSYDQIKAWNGGMVEGDILKSKESKHGFDFYVLIRRSLNLGILPKWWKRILYLDHEAVFKRNNMNSGNRAEKMSFSLKNIGKARCPGSPWLKGKEEFDANETWDYWQAGGRKREILSEYNVGDVELEADIEEATDYTSVFQSLCAITWCFPDTMHLQPSKQVDSMMLSFGNRKGVHYKTKGEPTGITFDGSFNDGPYVDGITENVHVADFKALYPSIMVSCNISPELLNRPGCTAPVDLESKEKYKVEGDITFDTSTLGILPECVIENIKLREEWKQKAKKLPKGSPEEKEASCKSMAYKMANNAYMGVVCSEHARFSDVKIGLAITRTGATLIKAAKEAVIARGWKVIYIDTDSLFVTGPKSNEEFKAFTDQCNTELFPRLALEWGCKTNTFYLDYEKAFSKVLFTFDAGKIREHEKEGGRTPGYNRKKYVYRLLHKGFTPPKLGSEVDAVGIESQRGDSSALAVELQETLISRIMSPEGCKAEDALKIVEDFRVKTIHTKHAVEEISISKSIRKEVDSYGDKNLPHLLAARMLVEKGREVREGTKVQFVVVVGSKSHPKYRGEQQIVLAEDYTGEADLFFVWERSVYPASYRILAAAFPGDDRFKKYLEPGAKAVQYIKRERAGQGRLFA